MDEADSELVLTSSATASKAARTMLVDRAGPFVTARVLGDAKLLVTELVANSFAHGALGVQDRIVVRMHLTAAVLRLEVSNPGTAGTIETNGKDPKGRIGHGLEMVRRLSQTWGVERGPDTCVWAELARAG